METMVLGLMLVVAIGVVVVTRGARVKALPQSRAEPPGLAHPYHCVVIRHPRHACAAVKRLSGRRLLSKEAPRLPLPECDADACSCRYAHFVDRRGGDDRRDAPIAVSRLGGYSGPELRSGRERRVAALRSGAGAAKSAPRAA